MENIINIHHCHLLLNSQICRNLNLLMLVVSRISINCSILNFRNYNFRNFLLERPRNELLIKFLENNGRNLKQLMIANTQHSNDNLLSLAIAKSCPNLKNLSVGFKNNELEALKII